MMELTTAQRLADLNRRFYEQHAEAFAEARPRLHPGVKRVLARIPAGAHVLELGCGDGKVGRWLAAHANVASYLGLDSSAEMLERAMRYTQLTDDRRRTTEAYSSFGIRHLSFAFADLTSPDWPRALPSHPLDWILAFAVFHHLPGFDARARILRALADHLAPGGMFVMSNWQFTRSERLKRRIVPWAALNLDETEVEPGDYLLSWERGGQRGLRYVHVLDEAEARRMAEAAGLAVIEVFRSDGVTGDLSDYVQMRKSG
jgi:SAM-dependent methyltransferase